ncbi:CTP synthase [Paenibacillus sp. HB172176]|uniref:CTP synthase C-terminal region-related (seleno)protein n=1 Tax=Paenibacillus sp. HB172176 TaxID=2493690 RepID=UPI00143926AD|nr:CTP synthase [Paenibacillus sp. HB172176]
MKIGIIGEFKADSPNHIATNDAIKHSGRRLNATLETEWISTLRIEEEFERITLECTGYLIAPGSPYLSMEAALKIIGYAREHKVPLLGTCGGYQHIVIEFARNVLGIADAEHAEYDPYASNLIVSRLSCSLAGQRLDIKLIAPHSAVYRAIGEAAITENYYCNFGLTPGYQKLLEERGLRTVGVDHTGESRIIELSKHPFFIGTLFVPQARSNSEHPHPIITSFVQHSSRLF